MNLDEQISVTLSIGFPEGSSIREEMTVEDLLLYGEATPEEYSAATGEKQEEIMQNAWSRWIWEYIDGGWDDDQKGQGTSQQDRSS